MNACLLYNGLNSLQVLGSEGKALNASLTPAFFFTIVSKVSLYFTFITITQKKKCWVKWKTFMFLFLKEIAGVLFQLDLCFLVLVRLK